MSHNSISAKLVVPGSQVSQSVVECTRVAHKNSPSLVTLLIEIESWLYLYKDKASIRKMQSLGKCKLHTRYEVAM